MELLQYDTLSYWVIGLTWISFLLFVISIWYLVKSPIYHWEKVCDRCTTSSARHQYVFRLFMAEPIPPLESTNFTVEVLRNLATVVKVTFGPKQLMSNIVGASGRSRISRLILYRNDPLTDLTHVIVNHDHNSPFVIFRLEIQEINENEANIAYIQNQIKKLDDGDASTKQKFGAANREPRNIEAELKPRPYPNSIEVFILFFLAVNLIYLLNIFVVPCKDKYVCNHYDDGLMSSVFAGISSSVLTAVLFVILCLSFRSCVKKPMFQSQKLALSAVRYLFLLGLIAFSIAIGYWTARCAAKSSIFPAANPGQNLPHEIYWMIANGIAIAVFFLILVPILSMFGYCIGFFSTPEPKIKDPEQGGQKNDPSVASGEGPNDYFNEILQGKAKVKSISQYRGQDPNASNNADPSVQQSATANPKSKTGSSAKLTTYGSSVKSGKGSKSEQKLTPSSSKSSQKLSTTGPSKTKSASSVKDGSSGRSTGESSKGGQSGAKSAGTGKSTGTAKTTGTDKTSGATKTTGTDKASGSTKTGTTNTTGTTKDSGTKKSGSQESIGTQYYQQIMQKQGKVKSVSQY